MSNFCLDHVYIRFKLGSIWSRCSLLIKGIIDQILDLVTCMQLHCNPKYVTTCPRREGQLEDLFNLYIMCSNENCRLLLVKSGLMLFLLERDFADRQTADLLMLEVLSIFVLSSLMEFQK